MSTKTFTDNAGVMWALVEGDTFKLGSYVRRIPSKPGEIVEGVQRIIHWDPNGASQYALANERPSKAFYEQFITIEQDIIDRIAARESELPTEITDLTTSLKSETDTTVLLTRTTELAELEAKKQELTKTTALRAEHEAAQADMQARVDSLNRLGADMLPIAEVKEDIRVNGS